MPRKPIRAQPTNIGPDFRGERKVKWDPKPRFVVYDSDLFCEECASEIGDCVSPYFHVNLGYHKKKPMNKPTAKIKVDSALYQNLKQVAEDIKNHHGVELGSKLSTGNSNGNLISVNSASIAFPKVLKEEKVTPNWITALERIIGNKSPERLSVSVEDAKMLLRAHHFVALVTERVETDELVSIFEEIEKRMPGGRRKEAERKRAERTIKNISGIGEIPPGSYGPFSLFVVTGNGKVEGLTVSNQFDGSLAIMGEDGELYYEKFADPEFYRFGYKRFTDLSLNSPSWLKKKLAKALGLTD